MLDWSGGQECEGLHAMTWRVQKETGLLHSAMYVRLDVLLAVGFALSPGAAPQDSQSLLASARAFE